MLFDLSYLTERALDQLVSRGIEKREYIIDEDDKDRANKYLLIGVILFAIFSLSVMFLVKPEDGNKAFLCIVFSMLAFTIIPLILPTHYILNLAAVTTLVLLVPLLYWHSAQRDNALFWRNTRLAIVGFLLIGATLLMPIFLNVNYMNKNLDKTRAEVKELLAQKIKNFDASNLFVLYFNPEQLINAIKKHNLEVDSTKKIEVQQAQPVSDKKDQEIIKALKNI